MREHTMREHTMGEHNLEKATSMDSIDRINTTMSMSEDELDELNLQDIQTPTTSNLSTMSDHTMSELNLEKGISINDIRDVKADTYSDSDSSDESPPDFHTPDPNHASEAVRRKRARCIMALSFIPFLLACAALGLTMVGLKKDATAVPVGGNAATLDVVEASSAGTISPSTIRGTTPSPTSSIASIGVGYPTISPVVDTPSPTAPAPSSYESEDEGHGNLRSTNSPTSSSPTVAPSYDGLPVGGFSLDCVRAISNCDEDDDCLRDLICQERNGLVEIVGCEGLGEMNSDYCWYPDEIIVIDSTTGEVESVVSATDSPVTSSPITNAPVTNAPVTNAPITNAPVTNAPVTNPPTPQPSATCTASGQSCEDKNTLCCSGVCEKDKDTKDKLCGWTTANPAPGKTFETLGTCDGSGVACNDKKMCCSGVCEKDKDTKEKLCG